MSNLRHWRRGVPRFFTWLLVLTAALSATASVSWALGARTQTVRAVVDALLLPTPANLGYAAFLAVLAAGVNNRKRVAYLLLVALTRCRPRAGSAWASTGS